MTGSASVPLAGPALHDAKRRLRTDTITARDALDPADRARDSRAIVAGIAALPSFVAARCVLLTLPFRSEWDARALLHAVLARGAVAALPRVDVGARMLMLHEVRDPAVDVVPGFRGIPEPAPHARAVAVEDIDWVLVPGVAFDPDGGRLGYGGGYYDRLLAVVDPAVPRVAGAFDMQVVDAVPSAPHDLRVHTLVTPSRTLLAGRG